MPPLDDTLRAFGPGFPFADFGGLTLSVSRYVAVLCSFALSFCFVVSLHLWKFLGYKDHNRDASDTIKRRFMSAMLSCAICGGMIFALADTSPSGLSLAELLGFREVVLPSIRCLALTATLFVGPLVQHAVASLISCTSLASWPPGGGWVAARNYALAPFTEEFVFRACLVRLWVAASIPMGVVIFLSPFFFALAHTHHYIEHVRRFGDKRIALVQVSFQVFYTSLFGMYANFLLLRTGSTTAVILTHSFCNHQGFPDLAFLVSQGHVLYRHRIWLAVLYCAGVAAFAWLLWPLTDGFASTFTVGRR